MPEVPHINSEQLPPIDLPIPFYKRKMVIIAAVGVLVLIALIGVILASKMQKKTPVSQTSQTENMSLVPTKVVCKRFTNLDEALKNVDIACVLDLSNQGLTEVPSDITKLTNLNELIFKYNKLIKFPVELLSLPNLYSLDLSNNKITTIMPLIQLIQEKIQSQPGSLPKITLQNLKLTGDNISEEEKKKIKNLLPQIQTIQIVF